MRTPDGRNSASATRGRRAAYEPPAQFLSIADVERETGVSKDTLRVWERRYGFPAPRRDASGERRYDPAELQRLRLIKRLLDTGHRPGRVVGLAPEQLESLEARAPVRRRPRESTPPAPRAPLDGHWLSLVRGNETDELRAQLRRHLVEHGIAATVEDLVTPLGALVGADWVAGRITVFQEHAFTEVVQAVFREAMQGIDHGEARAPRVLLTTLSGEQHALGLLMAECFLALHGCERLALGPSTPLADVIEAVRQTVPDVVALSFSAHARARGVRQDLARLRAALPRNVEIWVGGASSALRGRGVAEGVVALRRAADLGAEVSRWRAARAIPAGKGGAGAN